MLIDVHCHLLSEKLDKNRIDIIENCAREGILILNSTIRPADVKASLELSAQFKNVFTTVGLSASEIDPSLVDEVTGFIEEHRTEIVAIGEVGLDYHWVKDIGERERERENFREFIGLSKKLNLPLVVHSRDAEEDTLSILQEEKKPALMHCFSGSVEQAKEAVEFGCLISVPTSVIISKNKQKIAAEVPIENLVLETDAPYLSPERGKTNTPLNIKRCCDAVSELKGLDFRQAMEATTKNAIDFFNLKV